MSARVIESSDSTEGRFSGFSEDERWIRPDPSGWWRGWLAAAPHDARGVRRWLLWIRWTGRKNARARVHMVLDLLLKPVFGIKGALIEMRKYASRVKQAHGAGYLAQFLGLLKIQVVAGLPPIAYYKFQLYLPERRAGIASYVEQTTDILHLLRNRLPDASDRMIFRDKRQFEDWCRGHGLATIHNIIEVMGDEVVYRFADPVPAVDLFSKPGNASLGMGVARWRHEYCDGRSAWRGKDGTLRDIAGLEAELNRQSRESGRPFVLQRCLVNHPVIRALGNGALCTLRVMTVRDHSCTAQPLLMVLRIATGDCPADNFDLGGIATPVDLETGRCGRAIAKRGDYPLHRLSANPENGAVIEGLELPYWREAIALAVRAHTALEYSTPVVGWDIAVLEQGPILVEANGLPCAYVAQMPTGLPLGRSRYADCVVSRLKAAFNLV
jgi:hypothetical protein